MSARVDKDGDIEVFCLNCDSWASAWQDEICPLMMAGVVIVEWCCMMAGALPFGWHWERVFGEYRAVPPGGGETFMIERNAWEAEYRHRPRLEER